MKFASVQQAVELYRSIGMRPMPMYGIVNGACACGLPDCRAGKHAPQWVEETWKEGAEFSPSDFGERDNIAVSLGPWGGSDDWLVCLDVDGPFDLDGYGWHLPQTLEQKSPRGRHLFFTVPAFAPLGNWVDAFQTKRQTGGALDIRYARGRINVAPSRTLFGGYDWVYFGDPVPLPQVVVDAVLERRVERGLPVQWEWHRDGKRP